MRRILFVAACMLAVLAIGCGEQGPTTIEESRWLLEPSLSPIVLIPGLEDTHELGQPGQLMKSLSGGECILEHIRVNGRYTRVNRSRFPGQVGG